MVAFAMPAGITTRQAYESLRDELLADLKRAAPVDIARPSVSGRGESRETRMDGRAIGH